MGKTHLLNKYVKGVLPRNPVPTIGVEFATKTVTLKNGERVKAQIWDTGKQVSIFSRARAVPIHNNGVFVVGDVDTTDERAEQSSFMTSLEKKHSTT